MGGRKHDGYTHTRHPDGMQCTCLQPHSSDESDAPPALYMTHVCRSCAVYDTEGDVRTAARVHIDKVAFMSVLRPVSIHGID